MADIDRDQMTQVMVNLIKNAVEAMDGQGRRNPDQGRGIGRQRPDPYLGRRPGGRNPGGRPGDGSFSRFFTTKSIGKGVGLGLPICYGIVKMHRGTIWYDSVVGSGTQFHIELPKTQAMAGRSMLS